MDEDLDSTLAALVGADGGILDLLRQGVLGRRKEMTGDEDDDDEDGDWDVDDKQRFRERAAQRAQVADTDEVKRERCDRKRDVCLNPFFARGSKEDPEVRKERCMNEWADCLRSQGLSVPEEEPEEDLSTAVQEWASTEAVLPPPEEPPVIEFDLPTQADVPIAIQELPDWATGPISEKEKEFMRQREAEERRRDSDEPLLEPPQREPVVPDDPQDLFLISAEEELVISKLRQELLAAAMVPMDKGQQYVYFADDDTLLVESIWASNAFRLMGAVADPGSWQDGELRLIASLEAADVVLTSLSASAQGTARYIALYGLSLSQILLYFTRRGRTLSVSDSEQYMRSFEAGLNVIEEEFPSTPSMVHYQRAFLALATGEDASDHARMAAEADDLVAAEYAKRLATFRRDYDRVRKRTGLDASDVFAGIAQAPPPPSKFAVEDVLAGAGELDRREVQALYTSIEGTYVKGVTRLIDTYRVGAVPLMVEQRS